MSVTLVLTEHSGALTPETIARYNTVRERLESAAGTPVSTVRYEELESLEGADAVVLSGSYAPWAVHSTDAIDRLGEAVRGYGGPVLGICAGMQLQAKFAGGTIRHSPSPVQGVTTVEVLKQEGVLRGLPPRIGVYTHHSDEIEELPACFNVVARSASCAIEAIEDPARRWWGTQFHPEEFNAAHPAGERILRNFFELSRAS